MVKSFVREDYEIGKFHDISKYVYKLFTKAEGIVAWNSPVMQTVIYIVIILLVAISGRSIVFGTMETGEMTSVIVYAMQIMMSLMMVTFVFVMIMMLRHPQTVLPVSLRKCLKCRQRSRR